MGNNVSHHDRKDVSIVLCGQAGQGLLTVEHLLTRIFKLSGYNVFATKEYMSRVRGGMNSTQIRVSSEPVKSPVHRVDILVALDKDAVGHMEKRISSQTVILTDQKDPGDKFDSRGYDFIGVPLLEKAGEIGGRIYSNVIAVGIIAGLFDVEASIVADFIKLFFSAKSESVITNNLAAAKAGYELTEKVNGLAGIRFGIGKGIGSEDQILVNASEAVALGAIAGGCDFISSYPMSPSTSVLTFLAKHAAEFGIIAEQAEDEIAAINMAIGAWYAGGRGMVTTSGGGFALMTEGLSLAGMLESPLVIHLAQRPGPATGLPTRTEQGDLELALYSGHGEFPRIIFAPGSLQDAFYLTQKAFNLASKYQVPVIILTDQYLVDSYYNTPSFEVSGLKVEKHVVKTSSGYKRYVLTENGISPRGIPGFGDGFVCVDSDEHDQSGHITEDLDLRVKMVDKRLKKLDLIRDEMVAPDFSGGENYKNLIVCWGSTYHAVSEAVKNLLRDDVAVLHFKQVYPLHETTSDYLEKAERVIVVENNATSQFAKLIKLNTGIEVTDRIVKYDGLAFYADELTGKLQQLLGKG